MGFGGKVLANNSELEKHSVTTKIYFWGPDQAHRSPICHLRLKVSKKKDVTKIMGWNLG